VNLEPQDKWSLSDLRMAKVGEFLEDADDAVRTARDIIQEIERVQKPLLP